MTIKPDFKSADATNRSLSAPKHNYRTIQGTSIPRVTGTIVESKDIGISISRTEGGRRYISAVTVAGVEAKATPRFVSSMCGLIGQSKSVFQLFTPEEVLERVFSVKNTSQYRVQFVERNDGVLETVAVTHPRSTGLDTDAVVRAFSPHTDLNNVAYHDGIITTLHDPIQFNDFKVGSDQIMSKFMVSTPIDGYGSVSSYLAAIRAICSNLMVFYTRLFRNTLNVGVKDREVALDRFLSTLNNEEGFAAISDRMSAARSTYASVNEVMEIRKSILGCSVETSEKFRSMIRGGEGERSLNETYGVANFSEYPTKRLRCLPSKCSVYDLINFATEYGTHEAETEEQRREVNTAAAMLLSSKGGLDLEGVCKIKAPEARGLWLTN
jgi:hypothetical protein